MLDYINKFWNVRMDLNGFRYFKIKFLNIVLNILHDKHF